MDVLEKNLVAKISRALKGRDLWHLKTHGGPMQRAGLPDLLVIVQGRAVWLEVKVPGEKATRLQEHTIERLRAAGALAEVVYSVDGALAVVDRAAVALTAFDKMGVTING